MVGAGGRHLVAVSATEAAPRKARPIRFAPHVSGAVAFRTIAGSCLAHFTENRPAALAGIDDEGIHQARVALRRLRSALVLFEDYTGTAASRAFQGTLRDMARVLGEARDWDVFLSETLPAGTYVGLAMILVGLAVVVLGQRSSRAMRRTAAGLAELGTD